MPETTRHPQDWNLTNDYMLDEIELGVRVATYNTIAHAWGASSWPDPYWLWRLKRR